MTDVGQVLVVDDDPVMCAISSAFFQGKDVANVHEAFEGSSALELHRKLGEALGLIVCDLHMPGMDGISFLRQLRADGYEGQVAIVSGEDQQLIDMTRELACGLGLTIVGTIRKPVTREKLEVLWTSVQMPHRVESGAANTGPDRQQILQALEDGSIRPFYQPQISVPDGRVTGVEALARWVNENGGIVPPGDFIPAIDAFGLTNELAETMLKAAIGHLQDWNRIGFDVSVSVNMSARSMARLDFPDELASMLRSAKLDPSRLMLELTEDSIVSEASAVMEVMARLRMTGIGLSIDDFGTGFSNIEQLRRFPFSELKIDQMFVRNAHCDRFAAASVEASILLGRELGMKLVAEGVETSEDWDYIEAKGIDIVQGYYTARPMPVDTFESWYLENDGIAPVISEKNKGQDKLFKNHG